MLSILVSAAPDLLEACKLALQLIIDTYVADHGNPEVGDVWNALETSIKKAEGKI